MKHIDLSILVFPLGLGVLVFSVLWHVLKDGKFGQVVGEGMESKIALVKNLLSPFVHLDFQTMEGVAELLSPFHAEKGEHLFSHGEKCNQVILPTEGFARAYYLHEDKEVNLRLLCAPAVITSLTSLITGHESLEWIEALSTIRGYVIPLQEPPANEALLPIFVHLRRILAEQHYLALEQRLRMLQCKSAKDRFDFFCEHRSFEMINNIPNYHIASYLGITAETLSRILKK